MSLLAPLPDRETNAETGGRFPRSCRPAVARPIAGAQRARVRSGCRSAGLRALWRQSPDRGAFAKGAVVRLRTRSAPG